MPTAAPIVVVVPVKAFSGAKERLAPVLDPAARARLARELATIVTGAAAPLPVVVTCDDDEVRDWATAAGHRVDWTPGLDLNGAIDATIGRLAAEGTRRVLVAHADLPFATDLAGLVEGDGVTLVPDRHGDGTNVAVFPTDVGWHAEYGAGSFARHSAQARSLGLDLDVIHDPHLAWDVDHPEDLDPPAELGAVPWARSHA